MKSFFSTALQGVLFLLFELPGSHCEETVHVKHDVVDAFKIFEMFDYGIAMYDIDMDGDLDCLVARRTEFYKDGGSATFVWILRGLNGKEQKNITFHVKQGLTPDQPVFTVGEGPGPENIANVVFSDYQSCAVIEMPFGHSQECIMWVSETARDNVPQYCVDQYEDNCQVKHVAYDKDTCGDLLGDS